MCGTPVLPSDAPACPFSLSSQLSLGLFSMEPRYHALNHLTRQYFALISFWKSRNVKQLTCLIRSRGGVGVGGFISHNLVSWPGGGWCQPYPTSLLGSGDAVTTPDTQPGLSLHMWEHHPPRLPACSTVGALSSCLFWLSSLPRADRPGNGYRPRAAGEGLIQCWKGALVVKPFNGPHPMIISPGLKLANWEPL